MTTKNEFGGITVLNSAVVVEQNYVKALDAEKMAAAMTFAYAHGKQVVFVENGYTFFRPSNLIEALKRGDDNWRLIAERLGLNICPETERIIQLANTLIQQIIEQINGIKPAYPFARVPDDWSVEAKLLIKGNSVGRVNGVCYTLGIKTAEKLWLYASKKWASGVYGGGDSHIVSASGYSRRAAVLTDCIEVGCQTIQRYELEQLALHQGWKFPE